MQKSEKERKHYDQLNKFIFSEPRMVEDLLRGFFNTDWVHDLDFHSLERVNSGFITSNFEPKKRDSDIIWKLRWKERWLYLFIIIEFQSSVDPYMAVRLLSYSMLLYEQIIKSDKKMLSSGFLPPILPIVLYNGQGKWTASRSIKDLLVPDLPKGLLQYQPSFQYWLLDEGRAKINNKLASSDNFVSLLIQLEQVKDRDEAGRLTQRLVALFMSMPGADSFRRAYTVYLAKSLKIKDIVPDFELDDIMGVHQMLSDTVDKWIQGGFEKGISQGISQGMALGERAIIERLLSKKFGKLTLEQKTMLAQFSEDQLLQLSEKILFASNIEEILGEMAV